MKQFLLQHHKKTGIVIAILNGLMVLNSTYFFLVMSKFPIEGWLAFNACAPSVILFLIGFILNKRIIMVFSVPFLVYFGGGGLIVFSWKGPMIMAQISHILMIIAVAYILLTVIIHKEWIKTVSSFAAALICFAVIQPIQNNYIQNHPELLKKMGDPVFEKFIKKQV